MTITTEIYVQVYHFLRHFNRPDLRQSGVVASAGFRRGALGNLPTLLWQTAWRFGIAKFQSFLATTFRPTIPPGRLGDSRLHNLLFLRPAQLDNYRAYRRDSGRHHPLLPFVQEKN